MFFLLKFPLSFIALWRVGSALRFSKKFCIGGDSTLFDILQQIYTCIAISRETVIIEPTIFFPDGLTVFDILFGGSVILSLVSFFTWSDSSEFDD